MKARTSKKIKTLEELEVLSGELKKEIEGIWTHLDRLEKHLAGRLIPTITPEKAQRSMKARLEPCPTLRPG